MAFLWGVCGEEQAVRNLVEEVQTAALAGLNRRNPSALDQYFATVAEGAQTAGLTQIQQAYQDFVAGLTSNDSVQFHSFDMEYNSLGEALAELGEA